MRRFYTGTVYILHKTFYGSGCLKTLIPPGQYCPPGRHFGNYTRPIRKKGKR